MSMKPVAVIVTPDLQQIKEINYSFELEITYEIFVCIDCRIWTHKRRMYYWYR